MLEELAFMMHSKGRLNDGDDARVRTISAPPMKPGRRRPRPPGITPSVLKTNKDSHSKSASSTKDESGIEVAKESGNMSSVVAELTATCKKQSLELSALRQKLRELEASDGICTKQHRLQASCDKNTQTSDLVLIETCEMQRQQLDAIHKEVGDKGRELRKAQDTVRMLRAELEREREFSEQFRVQVEVLEEQLRNTLQKRSHEAQEAYAGGLCPMTARRRPASAGVLRAWMRPNEIVSGSAGNAPSLNTVCGERGATCTAPSMQLPEWRSPSCARSPKAKLHDKRCEHDEESDSSDGSEESTAPPCRHY